MKKLLPVLLLASVALHADAQTVTFSVPVTPCHNDGVLTASFSGLTPPLSVTWTTEGTMGTSITRTVTGTTDGLTGYSGGPVHVTVSDGVNIATGTFTGAAPISYTITATDAACPALGTVNAVASGGTAPYTYQWYNRNTGTVVAGSATTSLPTGDYGVIVTDAAGCKFGSQHINDGGAVVNYTSFTATVTATPANCTDGTATVSAVEATAVAPITYRWSNGATTPTIAGLSAGVYQVEIVDALGCKATSAPGSTYTPYSASVSQTTLIVVPMSTTPASCSAADGAITTTVTGGTAPYTYVWSNGATTPSVTGIPAGSYMVNVTDANGCTGTSATWVSAGSPIVVTTSSSPSLCTSNTGNASVSMTGGTAPYTVQWYTSPMQVSATATMLAPGTYRYRITDAAGCVQTGAVTVPPINNVDGTFSSASPLCLLSNGSVSVSPNGGAAPYSYLWSNGATTAGISSVPAGHYSVRITDNMGCKTTKHFDLESYSTVGAALTVTDASCILNNDGAIAATGYGGAAPYTFGWNTGATGPVISGLKAGNYSVSVTDATGCTSKQNTYVHYDAANTSCYCTIEGTVYNDTNSNCTHDAGEPGIRHAQVFCTGIGYTYTDANGHYSFMVPSGTYTITQTVMPYYPLAACQVNNIPVTATAATGCVNTVDFANVGFPIHNMRISTSSLTSAVPGSTYLQRVAIINEGTVSEDTAGVSYRPDGQLPAPVSFTPSGIFGGSGNYTTTGLGAIIPGAEQVFTIAYNVPTNMSTGGTVGFRDTVGWNYTAAASWADDHTPGNNVANYQTTVVTTATPIFKEVTPRGTGAAGIIYTTDSVLEFTIHFQNTTNSTVQNVVILDTLDSDLDWTTLHPVTQSAPCKVTVYPSGSQKVARFEFNNINLEPAVAEDVRTHGMVTYSIEQLPGLTPGTQIRNRASIYMDYNAPVHTNSTLNTIGATGPVATTSTTGTTVNSLMVYPNPAASSFHAVVSSEQATAATLTVTDITGRTVAQRAITLVKGAQTITTDISHLAPGMYLINVLANGRVYTQKLSVLR